MRTKRTALSILLVVVLTLTAILSPVASYGDDMGSQGGDAAAAQAADAAAAQRAAEAAAAEAAAKVAAEQAAAQQREMDAAAASQAAQSETWGAVDEAVAPGRNAAEAAASQGAVAAATVESSNEAAAAQPEEAAVEEDNNTSTHMTATAGDIRVTVDAPKGAFPEDVKLSVTTVATPESVLEQADAAAEDAVSLDVHFYLPEDPETEIEPKKSVTVTFSNINLDAETVDVYHEAEKIAETSGEGGTLELSQFSTYTFVKSSQGDPVVGQTTDEATQLTVHNLKLALKNGETASIDLKTDRSVAEYKNTNPNSEDYEKTFDLSPATWDVTVDGTSVEVDSNFVLTAKELGSSQVTLTHKPLPADGYWDRPDIKLTATFTVNVVTEVTYDGNGGKTAAGNSSYTSTYSDAASAVVDGNNFTKFGHTFKGWAKRPVVYTDGSSYLQPGDGVMSNSLYSGGVYGETLYAVWQEEEPITISINKTWDDDNDRDGKRPTEVTYTITGTVEGETEPLYTRTYTVASATDNPINVSKDDEGKQFYKAIGGKAVTYTVTENEIEDYTAEISEVAADGTVTIKNTHKPEIYESITVSKVWDDADNQDGSRPTNPLYMRLFKDGGATYAGKQKTVSESNGWTTTFTTSQKTPLYKYENGEEIDYTVIESTVANGDTVPDGYEMSVEGDAANGFTVTNTHMPEKIKITAAKEWDDADNQDGKRTDVTLTLEGRTPAGKLVSKTTQTHNTDVLPDFDFGLKAKHYEGEEIVWTLTETAIDGYDTTVESETDRFGNISYTVTNTHEPEKRTLEVTKSWTNEEGDTSRRSDVTVSIMADGTPINEQLTITGTADTTEWTGTIDLPKYGFDPETGEGGHEITYTVEEQDVPFYRNDGVTGDMNDGFTLTNTYIPNTTTVTINKVWEDGPVDGHPAVVHLTLMNNGKVERQTDLRDPWTITFTDVPVYADPSDPDSIIDYYVEEANNAGYQVKVEREGDAVDGYTFTVTNTKDMPEDTIDIPVSKVWIDDTDRDGKRPESVTVELVADGTPTGQTLTLSEENGWAGTFTAQPKYAAGAAPVAAGLFGAASNHYHEVQYTIQEAATDEYTGPAISGDATNGFTSTSTHQPEVIESIPVAKSWDDADNQDGIRPATVYVRLFKADGTYAGKQKAVSEDNGWATSFNSSEKTPIYKYENGQEIEYTVVESTVKNGDTVPEGYEMSVSGSAANGFTLTNTHKPELREITVQKVWDDNNDQDGVRPAEIYVALYADGERVRQRALNEGNDWTATIKAENQYKYKPGEVGVEIQYTVEESWVQGEHTPDDPETNYELVGIEGDMEMGFTITNKHEPEQVDINISKVWADEGDNNRDGVRPETITYVILADGEEVERCVVTEEANWEYTATRPKYDNGTPITYTVVEEVENDYVPSYEVTAVPATEEGENDQINVVVTNTYDPEKRTIAVIKKWEDNNDQDGKRPESVTVELLADGEPALDENGEPITAELNAGNEWAHYFEGVWKNDNKGSASEPDVQPIKYTVKEVEVPEGYESTASDYADSGYITITNTHEPETALVALEKVWKDDNNRDGMRPDSVTFHIEGWIPASPIIVYSEDIVVRPTVADDPNEWIKGITLPVYNKGKEIFYTVTEEAVPGYTVEGEDVQDLDLVNQFLLTECSFTNVHEPELVEIPVTKVWNDADNQDGVRPGSVRAFVYANGEYAGRQAQLSEANEWTATIASTASTKLYKYENGKEINYTVKESSSGASLQPVKDYTSAVTGSVDEGFTITNTHKPKTAKLTLDKIWEDGNNQDGLRPEYLDVLVMGDGPDGLILKEYALTPANGWHTETDELPVYKDGEAITYSVTEQKLEGYVEVNHNREAETTLDNPINQVTFLNVHEPETMTINVIKTWEDENDNDKVRPVIVEYTLFANGVPVKTDFLAEADAPTDLPNVWSKTYEDMPVYENGKKIAYTIVEDAVNDYTSEVMTELIDATDEHPVMTNFHITNTHEPGMKTITVVKTWDDADNQDGLRPEEVNFTLTGTTESNDSAFEATGTLNEGNGWMASYDVHVKDGGEVIQYAVEETGYKMEGDDEATEGIPEGYEVSYSDLASEGKFFTIKNTHTPETGMIAIQKTWDDDNNRDGKRPTSVTFDIYGTYEDAAGNPHFANRFEFTINESSMSYPNDWGDMIEVPKYIDGYEIYYTASERTVPEYEPQGYIAEDGVLELDYLNLDTGEGVNEVVNKHVPELVSFDVQKIWDDADDQDGFRPESIRVFVSANGEHVRQRELSEANGWKTTIAAETQYKYENGKEIVYTIDESISGSELVPVEGYTKTIEGNVEDGFTITNTHEPITGDITFVLNWDDANNQDGMRPDTVRVTLTASVPVVDPETGEVTDYMEIGTQDAILTAATGWATTWYDLPAHSNGEHILYTVTQEVPAEYTGTPTTTSATVENGGTVTLEMTDSYTPKTIQVSGNKIWDDASNQDGKRPESVTINLYADGELVQSQAITAENAVEGNADMWAYSFADLPKYYNGQPIQYNVSETPIPNYTLTLKGYDLVNTYTPGETFTTVIKLWDDDRDRDGLRPDNVIVRLLANGKEVNRASISAASGWFTIWSGLPINEAGEAITYSVTEDAVDGYTAEVTGNAAEGFVVKNSHTPEVTDVTVTKSWNDNDNCHGKRPDSITVYLMAENSVVATKTITAADGWKATFTEMPKNSFGRPVAYTVAEYPVKCYEATVIGTNIINSFCGAKACCPAPCPKAAMPATGDATSMAAIFGAALSGFGILAASVALRRKED